MTTKSRPQSKHNRVWCTTDLGFTNWSSSETVVSGEDTISYSDGRRKPSGAWPWKTCTHDSSDTFIDGGTAAFFEWKDDSPWTGTHLFSCSGKVRRSLLENPQLPSGSWDPSTYKQCIDQIDLNTSDGVLLYAGVIQALPFLGGVMKLNSICRRIIRETSKSFRRRPFTTVIKSLISADFIDRFVISPTLDDARKFADACNYTLRVLQTAKERSEHVFALSSTDEIVDKESTQYVESAVTDYGASGTYTIRIRNRSAIASKAFTLVSARYDHAAVDPLKVWAQRTGFSRPLDSVWDLVPFSFVADYFFRGGDFISHLSDEMSSIEGLKGSGLQIHDAWRTFALTGYSEGVPWSWGQQPWMPWSATWVVPPTIVDAATQRRSVHFVRDPIPNPYGLLLQLSGQKEDYLSVNLDLSTTRKRTLAELVIQAKL